MKREAVGTKCAAPADICHEAMRATPKVAKGEVPMDGQKQSYTVLIRSSGARAHRAAYNRTFRPSAKGR